MTRETSRKASHGTSQESTCPESPLSALDGVPLGPWRLRLATLAPLARVGWERFSLSLESPAGERSLAPLVEGIRSSGGKGVAGWLEVGYAVCVAWRAGGQADVRACGLEGRLLATLAALVPPGGHLMVEYESDHHRETFTAIARGVPPVLTPLGWLLWHAGLRAGFKAWYFAEGGCEGGMKLQADRARRPRDEARYAVAVLAEVAAFVPRAPRGDALLSAARDRGRKLLEELGAAMA